jgi:Uma2 family endonuclease
MTPLAEPSITSYARTRRWRRPEYERLVELGVFIGERLELLDGQLVVCEPHGSSHAALVGHIGEILAVAFGDSWHARLQAPLAIDDDSEPEPDVAIVSGTHRQYIAAHPSTAALIVEVADSSLRLDRRLKGGLYARARLPEYWLVNLTERAVEVYRRPEPDPAAAYGWIYRDVAVLRPPATVTPLAVPGAVVPVAELLP